MLHALHTRFLGATKSDKSHYFDTHVMMSLLQMVNVRTRPQIEMLLSLKIKSRCQIGLKNRNSKLVLNSSLNRAQLNAPCMFNTASRHLLTKKSNQTFIFTLKITSILGLIWIFTWANISVVKCKKPRQYCSVKLPMFNNSLHRM